MTINMPRGGSEILRGNLYRFVDPGLLSAVNIIQSSTHPGFLSNTKPNIMWQHLNTDEAAAAGLKDPFYRSKISKFVFVSDWQMQKYIREFGVDPSRSVVIKNAIEPIEFAHRQPSRKIQLIYTSTPWRGLHVLLDSFQILNRNDIELVVYSSTAIYGVEFMKNKFDWLFDRCRATPGVRYIGFATNKAVRSAVQRANILAYPSIFEETSCLAAIEAASAGCRIVTTDHGALPETLAEHARYVKYTSDYKKLAEDYATVLDEECNTYWNNYNRLTGQSKYFNTAYSWSTRATEWEKLLGEICAK